MAFARLNSKAVGGLENIYRHIEHGKDPRREEVRDANVVVLAVLAITLIAVVVFFPVTFLFGVSKYLFTALALAVVIALFASYFVAVTVVPLFSARYLKAIRGHEYGE